MFITCTFLIDKTKYLKESAGGKKDFFYPTVLEDTVHHSGDNMAEFMVAEVYGSVTLSQI